MFDFCNRLENLNAGLVPHGSRYNGLYYRGLVVASS
jgi:hypothetical protein